MDGKTRPGVLSGTIAFLLLFSIGASGQTTFSANPNPFPPDADGYAQVTLTWSAPSTSQVQIRVGSPGGPLFTTGGTSGSAQTGRWVNDGTRFFLLDSSSASVLTTLTMQSANPPGLPQGSALLAANNNGQTLTYYAPGVSTAEIHVNAPSGPLLARTGSLRGTVATGPWVVDGTRFYLVDVSGGKTATYANTIASTVASVTTGGGGKSGVVFAAMNNPIIDRGASGVGNTALYWDAPGVSSVQIHLGTPDGPLFATSASRGTALTGDWVTDGLLFYLQDASSGQPGSAANTLAVVKMSVAPPIVRYLAVAATELQINFGRAVAGSVYIFERDTLALLGQVPISDLSGPYNPNTALTSPDGTTLYVAVKRQQNAIAVVDVPSATLSTRIPLTAETNSMAWATGSGGLPRILANGFDQGVFVINPAANNLIETIPCPGVTRALAFNPFNQTTYASQYRPELCVITPQFTAGTPIALPAAPPDAQLVVLDNGEQGTIVAGDPNHVIDLRGAGGQAYRRSDPVPGLLIGVPSPDRHSIYLQSSTSAGRSGTAFRYVLSVGTDGSPQFTLQATGPSGSFAAVDDRFMYTASIIGTCGTPDGSIPCNVGLQILDPYTLQPRPANNALFMNQQIVAIVTGSYAIPPINR